MSKVRMGIACNFSGSMLACFGGEGPGTNRSALRREAEQNLALFGAMHVSADLWDQLKYIAFGRSKQAGNNLEKSSTGPFNKRGIIFRTWRFWT
jgi:hypothetical protein